MTFANELNDVGNFKLKKSLHIVFIIGCIYYYHFRHDIKVLYFPPAGPNLIPILRDIIILVSVRFLFKKTILHFHAGGVFEYHKNIPYPLRILYDMAYNDVDVAIRLSPFTPADGKNLKAKKEIIVPKGIVDFYQKYQKSNEAKQNKVITLLFVGVVQCSKGVEDLIRAVGLSQNTNNDYVL